MNAGQAPVVSPFNPESEEKESEENTREQGQQGPELEGQDTPADQPQNPDANGQDGEDGEISEEEMANKAASSESEAKDLIRQESSEGTSDSVDAKIEEGKPTQLVPSGPPPETQEEAQVEETPVEQPVGPSLTWCLIPGPGFGKSPVPTCQHLSGR